MYKPLATFNISAFKIKRRWINLKKMYACIPIILLPYTTVALIFLVISGFFIDPEKQSLALFVLLFVLGIYILALICVVFYCIASHRKKISALEMAKLSMLIKIIQIPAFLLIFIFGIFSFITIFTMIYSVIFLILDVVSIVLTGIVGASAVRLNYNQGAINKREVVIYTLMQFVFCLDVIIAILVFTISRKYNKTKWALWVVRLNGLIRTKRARIYFTGGCLLFQKVNGCFRYFYGICICFTLQYRYILF